MKDRRLTPIEAVNSTLRYEVSRRILDSADAVIGLGGISLVSRVEDRPKGEECFRYLFGMSFTPDVSERLFTTHRSLAIGEFRRGGDLVLYSNDETITHVGRVAPDGVSVISKWGYDGHVYQHPLFMVPKTYGDKAYFLRPVML